MNFRIDHIAIAVSDQSRAMKFFGDILGAIPGMGGEDRRLKYFWQHTSLGDLSRLEFLWPSEKESFLDSFLKKNPRGAVHHITLHTSDIYKARGKLDKHNIPYFGFNDEDPSWKELFIHPRDAFGVLIQIAEFRPDEWLRQSETLAKGQKYLIETSERGCNFSIAHAGGGKVTVELEKAEIMSLINKLKETIEGAPGNDNAT